jgi:3-deoxy-D-manno-octulosonic-acid transferase
VVSFLPYLLSRCVTGRNLEGLGQRLGFLKDEEAIGRQPLTVWLHGSSVGEVQAARALLREMKTVMPEATFVLSVMTEQGMAVARKQMAAEAKIIYAPLDLAGVAGRVMKRLRPAVYICLETELWPNILFQAHALGVKLLLLNGRMSERSFNRYRLFPKFMHGLLRQFSFLSVIDEIDAERYRRLGAPTEKVLVNGNAKYDFAPESCTSEIQDRYRAILELTKQPLLVAGSTHTGEEEILLEVFRSLRKSEAGKKLLWIVAPRHLHRVPEVAGIFNREGIGFDLFSDVQAHGRRAEVVLVDVIGELAGIYSVATMVFCGGSLVERGGHNVMEAAVCGKPVFFGPSMKDFADAAQLLESARVGFQVRSTGEMTQKMQYLLDNREEYNLVCRRAREIALRQQGSARRQAQLVKKILTA